MKNTIAVREKQLRSIKTMVAEQVDEILSMVFRETERNDDPATALQKITLNITELLNELSTTREEK